MEVILNYGESLCWVCDNSSCEWVSSGGTTLPDFVTDTTTARDGTGIVVRNCDNFVPIEELVSTCKRCGRKFVQQSTHTKDIEEGLCYDCHVDLKKTYKKSQPWGKPPQEIEKIKQCTYCGKDFVATRPGQKYCSEKCKAAQHARQDRKSKQRKANVAARRKWEFDSRKLKLEMQAQNAIEKLDKQFGTDLKELGKKLNQELRDYDKRLYHEEQELRGSYKRLIEKAQSNRSAALANFKEESVRRKEQFALATDAQRLHSLRALQQELEIAKADVKKQLDEAIQRAHDEIYNNDNSDKKKGSA